MQWIKIAVLANGMRFADGNFGMRADTARIGNWRTKEEMSKSRVNKQNRLRSQIRRQRNDVYKFKTKKK